MNEERPRRYRSIFWPILLIGVGAFWLLANLGYLPSWQWWQVWRLWPLFLIGIGLDLLFGRRSALTGALVAIVILGLAGALIFAWGSRGPFAASVTTDTFQEPLSSAASARVVLGPSVGETTVRALSDSPNLFEAEVTHVGDLQYEVSGTAERSIVLRQRSVNFDLGMGIEPDLVWTVGLSAQVPLDLRIEGGVGDKVLDLGDLEIRSLEVDADVGDLTLILPATGSAYTARLGGGVGDADLTIEPGADVILDIDGDVGSIVIHLPDGAEARVEADTDVGSVELPPGLRQIEGSTEFVGVRGVWETAGYGSAASRILIVFNGDVGDLIVR